MIKHVFKSKPLKPILVLAGSRAQYLEFLCENNYTTKDAIYVDESRRINGLEASKVVTYGTWYERKGADELLNFARARVR